MARSAFWTIIVNDQPTAFRAPLREDLLPTLKQLQRQHPDAAIKWFQRGRLWETPGDAMDASKPPRRGSSWRPGGNHKDPREQYKVPRDVKRARWAKQASEGRGPWVKDGGRRTEGRPQGGGWAPRDGGRPAQDGAPRPGADRRPARREFKPDGKRPVEASSLRARKPSTGPDGVERRKNWPAKDERQAAGSRPPGSRPPKPAWGPKAGGDRPRPAGGTRPDWRGDRSTTRRDATARSASAPPSRERKGPPSERTGPPRERKGPPSGRTGPPRERSGPPQERKTRTWRAGDLPPADRKRRKTEE
ncbi:MAG: hypothetical protein IT182_14425 [Acidobacteria bacterium]|nr:hypothetical protein [Acidobacteriota bacterium]